MEKKKRNAKGEGSFTVNPDGTVTHRKGVGFKPDGNRKTLTVTAPTKTACIKAMKKKEAEWNEKKQESRILATDTVAELCYKHLAYQIENGDLKPKSIDRRECTIENQIDRYDLGRMQLRSVTPLELDHHINLLIRERRLSESSIIKTVDVLNAAYDWAEKRGMVDVNIMRAIKPELVKKIKKISVRTANTADVQALSESEMKLFVAEASRTDASGKVVYPFGAYCLLLLYTGMRVGEMIALRWKDIDFEEGLLTIEKSSSMAKKRDAKEGGCKYIMHEGNTKNQKARNIQLTEDAILVLQAIRSRGWMVGEDDLIAPTRTGNMNTATNLEHRMKTIMKNAGLEYLRGGLHIFRKTFATRMYESGARVEEIAAYIGDLESTTRKYYIAIRKKLVAGDSVKYVVRVPAAGSSSEEKR